MGTHRFALKGEWVRRAAWACLFGPTLLAIGCGGVPPSAREPAEPSFKLKGRVASPPSGPAAPSEPASAELPQTAPSHAVAVESLAYASRAAQASRLYLSADFTCALAKNGDDYCWGKRGKVFHHTGPFQELVDSAVLTEDGKLTSAAIPPAERTNDSYAQGVPAFKHLVRARGGRQGCGLSARDSTLQCFGVAKHPLGQFIEVVTGSSNAEYFCGVRPEGKAECWFTESPTGGADDALKPPQPVGTFRQISAYCGLRDDSTLSCWAGYLGEHPELLPKLKRLYYSTGSQVCGLDVDGNAGCWGLHVNQAPVRAEYDYAYFGELHACGFLGDRLECWGYRGRDAQLIPAEIGTFLPNRSYKLGRSSVALDAALEPLPKVDVKAPGCRKRPLAEAKGASKELIDGLLKIVPTEHAGFDAGLLAMSVSNSADPVWISCPKGDYLRWSYQDISSATERHDLVISRPDPREIADLRALAKRTVRNADPNDREEGAIVQSLTYRGHPRVRTWDRKLLKGRSDRFEGIAAVRFEVEGLLVTETTNDPASRMPFFSESVQLDLEALRALGKKLATAR